MEIQLNSTKIENLNISGGDVFIKNKKVLVNSDIIREYPPDDEIWYTSVNNTRQDPNIEDFGTSTIISHTYENGRGVIKFDEILTTIGDGVYGANGNITSIYIPSGVTSIGESAFEDCFALTDVYMMPNVAPAIPDYYVFGYYNSVPNLNIWVPSGESFWSYANHEYWGFYIMQLKQSSNLLTDKNIKTINGKNLIGSGDITLTASDVGAIGKNSNGYVTENIIPESTTYNLGSTSKKWGNVYANNFKGTADTAAQVKVHCVDEDYDGLMPIVCVSTKGSDSGNNSDIYTIGDSSLGFSGPSIYCKPIENALIFGTPDAMTDTEHRLYIGPDAINGSNLSGGFNIDTKGGGWSLGSEYTDAELIYGSSGEIFITSSRSINISGSYMGAETEINIGNSDHSVEAGEGNIYITAPQITNTAGVYQIDVTNEFLVQNYSSQFMIEEEGVIRLNNKNNTGIVIYEDEIQLKTTLDSSIVMNGSGFLTLNSRDTDNMIVLSGSDSVIDVYTGKFNIDSNCYAIAFYETSDENLKDFSNEIAVDFNKLKEVRKSYFTWKDGDGKLQIGTSAQDIQKIYPELVSENGEGNLTVDYAKLSLVALAAIDKLDSRLSQIEKILNITE